MNLSKPKVYSLPMSELRQLGFGNVLPSQSFSFSGLGRLLFINGPGHHMATYDPFNRQFNDLTHLFTSVDPKLSSQDTYRCLAIGDTYLASCIVNKKSLQKGSNIDPPDIEVLNVKTGKLSWIRRENIRHEQESLGFYDVLALSLCKKGKRLAVLERFTWMPWTKEEEKMPVPPRLRLFEIDANEKWKMVGKTILPWQATRFLTSFEEVIVLTGRHDLFFYSSRTKSGDLAMAPSFGAVNMDTFHPAFQEVETITLECINTAVSFMALSFVLPPEKEPNYFYITPLQKKPELKPFPKNLQPVSNILFVKEDTLAYVAKHSGKVYYSLVLLSLRTGNWEEHTVQALGFCPPPEHKNLMPPKGKLVLLENNQLALYWCKAPLHCFRFFSIVLAWTPTGTAPEPMKVYVWSL